jgi:H+-transporting ATPase
VLVNLFYFLQVDSCWEFIGLLPFRDDLRTDSADATDSLIDFGLDIRVLTGDSASQLPCCFSIYFI